MFIMTYFIRYLISDLMYIHFTHNQKNIHKNKTLGSSTNYSTLELQLSFIPTSELIDVLRYVFCHSSFKILLRTPYVQEFL